ncbi:hypothetical protein NIES22_16470 [Calothrix brevissima NIES-22]|nr:hypothetical protein NIES22_16470 [Calothrix brevissima NIES-22]
MNNGEGVGIYTKPLQKYSCFSTKRTLDPRLLEEVGDLVVPAIIIG